MVEDVYLGGSFVYYGLNVSSFFQVGSSYQVVSCYQDWSLHVSVGSETNKLGLVMRVLFLMS